MPILIRRGGQYVRYNGKYATDIDLCDCTCDDYPPDCTCESLPDTLYAKLTKYQWVAGDGVIGIESVTWDITLEKGCPAEPELPCSGPCVPANTWHGTYQERSFHGCNGIPFEKYMMDGLLTVECFSGGGLVSLSACNNWHRLVTCPDGYTWQYPTASPKVNLTIESCAPGEIYATYENANCALGGICSLIISSSSF